MGELVCEHCGYVVSTTLLDQGPEWRAFNEEQKKSRTRVGLPLTLAIHDRGFSTNIDWRGRDGHGRSRVSGSTDRNLAYALSEMAKAAYKLRLPKNVLETASMIYRRAINSGLVKGHTIQSVASASLYMACRQCSFVRGLDEVARASIIAVKEHSRAYRHLLRNLDADVPRYDPHSYLSMFVSQLSMSGEAELVAKDILDHAVLAGLTRGRAPSSIAAAATYIACQLTGDSKSQGDIAKAANVTEVTIRSRYKELVKELNIMIKL
jgi:transcription initiation factor TFIIB